MNIEEQPTHREQWKALIDKQEQSGLSQKDFCNQHNLILSKFTYYRGIIRASDGTLAPKSKSNIFSSVKISKAEIKPSADIRILLPNGFQCFIPSHVAVPHIKSLMEALLSC